MILFTAKLSEKNRANLKTNNPDVDMIFSNETTVTDDIIQKAAVVVTYGEDLDQDFVERATNLKWIHVLSAGVEKLPFEGLVQKDVLVTNSKGIHKTPMAEYAIFQILQVLRDGKKIIQNEANSVWEKPAVRELHGRTMLIIGIGAIGGEVARLFKAFGVHVVGLSRSGSPVAHVDAVYQLDALEETLPKADIVVSILPSTKETVGLLTEKHFKLMQDHAIFLNMGRGDVTKSEVILKAIQNKEIGHAILDVFETEPLPKDHPFWNEAAITITPHVSGSSNLYQKRALEIFTANLEAYFNKTQNYQNEIDLTRGY